MSLLDIVFPIMGNRQMARVHLLGHLSSTDTATDRIYLSSFRIGSKNALRNYLV